MSKNHFTVRHVAVYAALIAIYFVISLFSFEVSGVKITFDSLPVTVAAMLGGVEGGILVGCLGELLKQIVRYGVTATTLLWIIPPALRGLIIGLGCMMFRKKMQQNKVVYFAVCIIAAVITALGNTMAYYLDSKFYGYYNYALIFGVAGIRVIAHACSSLATAAVAIPVLFGLKKAGFDSVCGKERRP